MASRTDVFNGSTFEQLESRLLLTGAFPASAQNAIVYDAQGNLDAAYYDASAHNLKYVQENVNGVWSQPVVIDGSSSDVGQYVAIAINGQGNPAVAYQDSFNGNLRFAQYDGSAWQAVTVDKRKTTGFNPSLAFNAAGSALISYYKQNTGDLELATFKNKKWTIAALQTRGNVGQSSSIAINPTTGKPAVAFSNSAGNVQYVSGGAGKTFTKPVSVGTVAAGGTTVSLAFSGTSAAVGFVDPGTGDVKLGQLNGKKFATSTIDTITAGQGGGAQVLIDPTTHKPSVVYHDSNGVYVAAASTDGSGFQVTQISTGGQNTVATIQPGSGSIVFSTVSTDGSSLNVNTTGAAPIAPSNVAAAANSTTTATITWSDNSDNEAGFLIERSTDGVTFTNAGIANPNISTYYDTGLIEGTLYYYRVSAIGAAGHNSGGTTGPGSNQLVRAMGIATTTTLPAAPSGLTATPNSPTMITVNWINNSHALTGFQVDRSPDGTTWTQVGTVGSNVAVFMDSGLTEATAYHYRVTAYNATGGSVSLPITTATLPQAPSALQATVNSTTSISLTWQNNSSSATGFIIQRSTDGLNFSNAGTALANATSFDDNGLTEASAYYYRVVATGPGGVTSSPSDPTNATTDPAAPANFIATARSSTRIDLSWTNASQATTGYTLQRSSNSGPFVTIAPITNPTTTTFSDINLSEGVFYSYRVQTTTGSTTTSGFSAIANITTLPAAPTNLSASVNGLSVTLTWTDNAISESGFPIQRSSDNGAHWTTIYTAPAVTESPGIYTDSTASQGETYLYQVAATNAAGISAYSNSVSATIIPAAPTGLTATAGSATEMDLAWTDNSLGETGIHIERSADGISNWTDVTTTSAYATSYPDTGLTAGTTYYYRISAVNSAGASDYSSASGMTAPLAPATITAQAASTSSINLSWAAVSTATSYIIQRTLSGVTTTLSPVTNTSFTDLNLTEGTTYQYTVTAVNAGGSSVPGGPTSGTTLPAAPSNAAATGISATSVLVTWANHSNGATGMLLQRSTDAQAWGDVGQPLPNQTSFTDSTAQEATTYYYQIKATNAGGSSTFAVTSAVTTVPAAPNALGASAVDAHTVSLSWTNNSQGATGYTIQRGTDGENFGTIGTVDGSTHVFTDSSALSGVAAYYRVYATGLAGPSDYSNDPQVTTVPVAPQNVTAAPTSATSVNVTWSAVTGATGYAIERSLDGTNFSPLNTSSTNSYTDGSVFEATQYFYRVSATNSQGTSVASAPSTGVTTVPSAPTGVSIDSTTDTSISISWTNTSHAATSFSIERSGNNGVSFSPVGTALGTDTTYTDSSNLTEGSAYIYRVRAVGTGGPGSPSSSAAANTNPAAPSNLTLTTSQATAVAVSWTRVSTHATGYIVSRADNGGGYNIIATLAGTASSFNDTVGEDGSYQYQVRAVQLLGDNVTTVSSDWTNALTITTVPATPSNVNATAVGASTVTVTWTNQSPTATSFNIYRSGGSPWTFLGNVNATDPLEFDDTNAADGSQFTYAVTSVGPNGHSPVATSSQVTTFPPVPANVTTSTASNPSVLVSWDDVVSETEFNIERNDGQNGWQSLGSTSQGVTHYLDGTAHENVTYQYRVAAFNASGASAFTAPASASTFLPAPSGLSVTSNTSSAVSLHWTDHAGTASGYEVQRSTDGGAWQSLTSGLASNTTTYTDSGVADGTSYSYQVRGLSGAGNSDFSASTNAITPLLAPTNLQTSSASTTEIDLSWTNPSASATSFQIWRDTGSGFTQIDSVSTTTYADETLTQGQTASYEIIASSADATSVPSASADGITLPAGPTNLDIEPIDDGSLALTWTDNSSATTGYQIYRDSGLGLVLYTTLGAHAVSFTDMGLDEGTSYTYQVVAINDGGPSAPSNSDSNTTYCAAPSALSGTPASATSITLHWTNNSGGADGYIVTMAPAGGQQFDIVPGSMSLNGSATQYTVTGLTEGTQYQFQVYAYNVAGPSGNSNTASATTVPATPSLDSAVPQANGVHLAWTGNSANFSGFQLQRSTDGGGTFPVTFNIAANLASYVDASAIANTQYTYQIVAIGAGGDSDPSNARSVLTLPIAPTNFAVSSPSSSSVHLSWTPDTKGAGGYTVERHDANGWSTVGTPNGAASSFDDNTVDAGATYTFRITATNNTGSASAVVSASVDVRTAAPTGLTTASITASAVILQWNDVTGETGFTIQRSPDGVSGWTHIGTTTGQTTFTDSDVTEGTQYYYAVAGSNSSGLGDASSAYGVLTLPAAPTGLVATPISGTDVDLAWINHAGSADGYDVWRSANGGVSSRIAHGLSGSATNYPDTGASPGTNYSYEIYAYNATGNSGSATQTALTVPGQPQSFAAVAASSSEIDLTWNSVTTATQYTVRRSPDGSTNWQTLGQTSTLAFSDENLTEGTTYYYEVIAANATGGGQAAIVNAPTLPVAVIDLTVSASSATHVTVSWVNNSVGATGYDVYRQTNNAGMFMLVDTISDPAIVSFDDTVSEATTYTYRVFAVDISGKGPANDISITTVPAMPTLDSVTPASSTVNNLSWTNNSAHATGFTVERTLFNANNWQTLTSTLPFNATTYSDMTAAGGTEYQYRVTAHGAGGNSAVSSAVSALTYPSAVTTLGVTTSSTSEIDLSWTAVVGASSYKILRSTTNANFTLLDTAGIGATSYHDDDLGANLAEGTRYYYQVVANDATGDSATGNTTYSSTLALAPSDLTLTVVSNHEIDLAWTNNSAGSAVTVGIEQSQNGSSWSSLTTVASPGVNSYHDHSVLPGGFYYYRVSAIDEGGTNYMSDMASVGKRAAPDAPAIVATPLGDGTVSLTWNAPTSALTYTVQHSTGGAWTDVATATSATTAIDSGLTGNTTYDYRVLASNASADSAYSDVFSVLTVPTAPSAVTATATGPDTVSLNWSGDTDPFVLFAIFRAPVVSGVVGTYGQIDIVTNATSYSDTGLDSGSTYSYQIITANDSGSNNAIGTSNDVLTYPAAVGSLSRTVVSTTEVDLSWADSVGATSYEVLRKAAGDASFSILTGSPLDDSATGYQDMTASPGTTYTYEVTAIDDSGSSSATIGALTYPDVPANLAMSIVDNHHISVQWDAVASATSYTLQRAANGGAWANVNGVSGTSVTDVVGGGGSYVYRVKATNPTGDSTWATGSANVTVPDAPGSTAATASSDTAVHVTWTDVVGATGYVVMRSDDGGGTYPTSSTTLASNAASYDDTSLAELTTYKYKVIAIDSAGNSADSAVASVVTQPTPPSGLATTSIAADEVDLTWTDNSNGGAGFDVQRADFGQNNWATIGTTDSSTTTYQDTAVAAGTSYSYRIVADNGSVASAPSAQIDVLTLSASVTHIVATPNGTSEVDLAWDTMTGADTYDISVNINGGGYNSIATGVSVTNYTYSASAGTSYVFKIVAENATGAGNPGTSNAALTIPGVPGTFTATPINANEIDLSWADVTGATSYVIERATEGGNYGPLVSGLASNATSYHDTTADGATAYHYRIHAVDATGSSATTTGDALTVPDAVTITTAEVVSDIEIELVWEFDQGTIDGYRVYRADDNNGTFLQAGLDMTSNTSAYVDFGLASGTAYDYRVVAFNATGESAISDTGTLTTIPEAPTDFAATPVSDSEINLSWTGSTGATSYEVDRQNPDQSWTPIAPNLPGNSTGYQDTNRDAGTSYTYRVEAIDDGGPSVSTESETGLTLVATPTNVVATPNGTSEVDLNWDAMTGADSYDISVNINGGGYNSIATGVTGTMYTYSAASAGTSYVFQVVANDATGPSDPGTSNAALTIPDVPGGFTATPIDASEVDLSWTDVAGAASYTIERALGNTAYGPLVSGLASNTTSYQDMTIAPNTTYHYRIHATNATGSSATATQTVLTFPDTVTITSATVVSDTEIDLAWLAGTGAVDGYRIYRNDNNSGNFLQVGSDLSSSTLSVHDTGLTPGTSYVYRIIGFNATGESADNDTATLTVPPATPTSFAVSSISSSEIDLSWGDVNGATKYEVDRYNGSTWDILDDTLASNAVSFHNTGLDSGTSYTYRVEAIDAGGPSVPTTPTAAFTRPDVVANFAVAVQSSSEIDLTWDAVNGATGYRIMQSENGGGYSQIDTTVSPGYHNVGLDEGATYSYAIIAYDDGGDGASTTTLDGVTYLVTPDFISLGATSDSVSLQWTDRTAVDATYEVDQYISGVWTDVYDGVDLSVNGETDLTTITGLTEATIYQFQVIAHGPGGTTSIAPQVTVPTAPADPTNLTANPVSPTSINLSWNNNSANADSYVIERANAAGNNWAQIAMALGSASTYTDHTVTEATTYQYRISGTKGSSTSNTATTASTVTSLPLAPSDLTPTVISATEIDLSWSNNSAGATAYRVYRSTDGIHFAQYGSDLADNATSYNDTSAPENATTYYIVVAVDDGGESAPTADTSATTPLAAPSDVLAATTVDTSTGDKTVALSWTNNSTVATSISIERGVNGSYSPLTTVSANSTSYSDDTALENTTYTYRVWAIKGQVSSIHAASNFVTTLLSRPTSVLLSSETSDSVTLTWTDISSVATAYHIERSTDGTNFSDINAVLDGSANSFTDTGLDEGTPYYYRLRAATGGNSSNYSDVQSVTTIPATADSLVATPFSTTEIDLSWTDASTTNTSYTVERSPDGSQWQIVTGVLGATAHSYNNTGLIEATDYEYEVLAIGAGGPSLASNVALATTIPAAPTGVSLTSNSTSSVTISWTNHTAGATNIEVQRFSNGSWTTLSSLIDPGDTSYTDSTVDEGTAYQYRVRASRNGTESAYSGALSVTALPLAPDTLAATTISTSEIDLTWNNNSAGTTHYLVERSDDNGGTFNQIASLGANATSYNDSGLTEGVDVQYRVRAQNAGGYSDYTSVVEAFTLPEAPSAASATPTSGQIELDWTDNSQGESGYIIQRQDSGVWTQIASLPRDSNTFVDTGNNGNLNMALDPGQTYHYRIFCSNDGGDSDIASVSAVAA